MYTQATGGEGEDLPPYWEILTKEIPFGGGQPASLSRAGAHVFRIHGRMCQDLSLSLYIYIYIYVYIYRERERS